MFYNLIILTFMFLGQFVFFDLLGQKKIHHKIKDIYWSDGDSGRIFDEYGRTINFRLDDWDSAETFNKNGFTQGAKCKLEIERGLKAKKFMIRHSIGKMTYTTYNERDKVPGRYALLVDIYSNGKSLSILAYNNGHLKSWKHFGSKALERKPTWCKE